MGVAIPVTVNPVPPELTAEIVVLVLAEFVNVIACCLLLPTATFPNATLPGLGVKFELAARPLPTMVNICGEPGALSVNAMLPVAAPVAVGAKCALKERFCPPANVVGRESPLIPKPVPATVARLMVRLEFPLLVSLTLCVPL